jgi:carboxypeptidase PM20D1
MIILWIAPGIIGLLLILLLAAVIRTLLIPNKQSTYQPDPDPERAMAYAEKLSAMTT